MSHRAFLAMAGLMVALAYAPVDAQQFELTVRNIMRGPELVGSPPSAVRWTDDGEWIYFRWKPGGQPWHADEEFYRVAARGGAPERVTEEHMDSVGPLLAAGAETLDRRWKVVTHGGDLWLIDRRRGEPRRLTDTEARETNPTFGRDGRTVYFTRDGDAFALDLEGGALRQLMQVAQGPERPEREPEGLEAYLEEQQIELLEHIRREVEKREESEAEREARRAAEREPVRLANGERLQGVMVSPTERWALIQAGRRAEQARQTLVPDYVTASGYTRPLEVRSKVGDYQSTARVGLVPLDSGGVTWLDVAPETAVTAADSVGLPDGDVPDLAMVALRGWNRPGTLGLIESVSYDFKHRWLHLVDAATGEVRELVHDYDRAWIGGPCGYCSGWLPDGRGVWFVSERDGYSHLYTVGVDGQQPRQLTDGDWEVHHVTIAPDERSFFLTTNEDSPHEYHFYRMGLDGSRRTRITEQPGIWDVTPSPDGERLAAVFSTANTPPELFTMKNRAGAPATRITDSPTDEWRSFPWVEPEIVRFRAQDGATVPARIYRPSDVGGVSNGAGVIFVHGAGYLQNVHRGWSTYFREYMFHHLLASRGYTVLDIDYRGSEGYGRDWRTAIYRHMGGKDLSDQVDGARYLAEHEGVDPSRIGIYGGSYGGFITLMALFTEADRFAAGAALRAVTDWAHYNHWYTGQILNLPQHDDEAYRRSSPIYFAEGLEDPLLIAHGMVDTNVHYQDVVRLAQRLIELGKEDWELAVYPVEGHGFVEPSSWTDEYRRILELFERHLR
ncbi:MAG: prolyl oligopeptidase family serine peptidase [Gemmatimonadota bacterium]